MKTTKLIKLDGRFKGSAFYTHRLEFLYFFRTIRVDDRKATFIALREEFWDKFGPSCELEHVRLKDFPDWAWESNPNGEVYIYLKNSALSYYLLKE